MIVDRRVDQFTELDLRIASARTFLEFLALQQDRHDLGQALRAEWDKMGALTRGWTYAPPPLVSSVHGADEQPVVPSVREVL